MPSTSFPITVDPLPPGPDRSPALPSESIPVSVRPLSEDGDGQLERRDYQKAFNAYERAIELYDGLPAVWYNKALSLYHLGRYEEALAAFQRSLELKCDYAAAWSGMGVALLKLGRPEKAIEALHSALDRDKEDARAWYNVAGALLNLERLAEASSALENAHRLKSAGVEWLPNLYKMWSLLTVAIGVEAAREWDLNRFAEEYHRYLDIADKARQDGLAGVVAEGHDAAKKALKAAVRRGESSREDLEDLEEMELALRLLSIRDPFQRWKALTKEISKVWPKDVSAVDAIREQRR